LRIVGKVTGEAFHIARFHRQIHLALERAGKLADDFHRLKAAGVGKFQFDQRGQVRQDAQVGIHLVDNAGAAQLDRDMAAILQGGKCTWAMDAEPMGLSSKLANSSSGGLPSLFTSRRTEAGSTGGTVDCSFRIRQSTRQRKHPPGWTGSAPA
jgi:hypothetical protein